MPCMGPGINEAQFEEAYYEIMTLLRDKYAIQSHPPFFLVERMLSLRKEINAEFKETLRKIMYQQACEDF